jgi:hypothetical protein
MGPTRDQQCTHARFESVISDPRLYELCQKETVNACQNIRLWRLTTQLSQYYQSSNILNCLHDGMLHVCLEIISSLSVEYGGRAGAGVHVHCGM